MMWTILLREAFLFFIDKIALMCYGNSRWNQMKKTENWPFPMLTCELGGFMHVEKNAESLTVSAISGCDHLLDSVEISRKKVFNFSREMGCLSFA